jgi:ABC-type transport system involved in cytochrome c biogenesis permease subunit
MASIWLPLFVVILVGGWLLSKGVPPKAEPDSLDLVEFGKLPVVYQGRVKPIDTLARNSLRILSERETFYDKNDEKQPAIRWLLDVMARPDLAFNHRVFRIRNHELLGSLNLEPRKGYWYSAGEIFAEIEELQKQAKLAREVEDMSELDRYQRAVLELEKKVGVVDLLYQSFELPRLRPNHLREDLRAMMLRQQELDRRHPPLAIPPVDEEGQWQCYTIAWTKDVLGASLGAGDPNPATDAVSQILAAYARIEPLPDEEAESGESAGTSPAVPSDEDADGSSSVTLDEDVPLPDREELKAANQEAIADFNREVGKYRRYLKAQGPADLNLAKTNFEAYFNHFHPFFYASWVYLVAFVLALLGWLGWMRPLNRAAFWLIALTLLVHSLALVARVYISGRPPVTNLYSSAVFIGWGCVVMGMFYEPVFRNGIGNIVAAISGFLTLQIAFRLAGDGDTFVVLQAVLDTQFWLATHVVLITLGYSATFVAGLIGILYVVKGIFTPNLTKREGKELARMIYGTLCFAIFFSFVGTVLGGLWADDSWGRFWGWDPKENGALVIVLWNAIVLHARWGGLVRERGLALLAMGGNIATSWSWFGVNELGVGLHSYGFTEGVLLALLLFGGFNLVVIGLGCIPPQHWWSIRSREPVEPVDAAPV